MELSYNLKLGEKIRIVREVKSISQAKLAEAISYSAPRLSQIETGEAVCQPDILLSIKKALNLEEIPLYESERQGFKDKLYRWYGVINDGDYEKARKLQERLSDITYLPFDTELNHLYGLFRCRLLIATNDIEEAKEIMEAFDPVPDGLGDEILYHYYYNMGLLNYYFAQFKHALGFFLKAKKYIIADLSGNEKLYYNIAMCLLHVGHVVSAILFLKDIRELHFGGQSTAQLLRIDVMIAIGHIHLGQLPKAKKMLEKCYQEALNAADKEMVGRILHSFGILYQKAGDWNASLEHLNQASGYYPIGSQNHLLIIYSKIRCYADMRAYSACAELLKEGKKIYEDNKTCMMLLESAKCLIPPADNESIEYLDTVAIPHFLGLGETLVALDFCEFLREHYEKKGIIKKAGQMSEIARRIYKDMHSGGII